MSYNSKYTGQEVEDILDKSIYYIFPFTLEDLIEAKDRHEDYRLNEEIVNDIKEAIQLNRRILLKISQDLDGYCDVVSIYNDDLIYLHYIDIYSTFPPTYSSISIDTSGYAVLVGEYDFVSNQLASIEYVDTAIQEAITTTLNTSV